MTDDDRRKDDVIIAQLSQRFQDFVERYDRDCGGMNEWRRTVELELKTQGEILREISPAYTRGKWIVGIIMVGSLGIAVKEFWRHVAFK
jgi:hypothetical protein